MSERGSENYWARVMWQRHGVPMEVFAELPVRQKLKYIACELLEEKDPVRFETMLLMRGGGR